MKKNNFAITSIKVEHLIVAMKSNIISINNNIECYPTVVQREAAIISHYGLLHKLFPKEIADALCQEIGKADSKKNESSDVPFSNP